MLNTFLLLFLPFTFTCPSIFTKQVHTGKFTIKGKISGIETVKLHATGFKNRQICQVDNGVFFFQFDGVENGEYIYLSVDSARYNIRLLTEIDSVLEITIDMKKWPIYKSSGSIAQLEYANFFNTIQMPFNVALDDYRIAKQQMALRDSASDIHLDSKYKNVIATYRKETLKWILLHPDSLFTPELILRWWPKNDYRAAYQSLSDKVKESYFGRRLKEKLKGQIKYQAQ